MTGIYCFTNLINGKVYIGQAINIEARYCQHLRNINNLTHQEAFYKALRKYGIENFSFQVLEECDVEDLSTLEKQYIQQYNAYGQGGYNETMGGEGCLGYKHTEKTKEKMSCSRKGRIFDDEWKAKLKANASHHTAWNKGKKLSQDHREKISDGLVGHKHTTESKQKMSDNSTNKQSVVCDGMFFDSITKCADYYGVKFSIMRDWLDGYSYTPKEFYDMGLRYQDREPNYSIVCSPVKEVCCDGVVYNSISQCALYYGVDRKLMSKWLNKQVDMPLEFIQKGLKFSEKICYKSNPKKIFKLKGD